MQSIKKKTNLVFYQIIGIGLIFLALIIFLGMNLYPKMILVGQSLVHKLETICGCTNHWSYINHPFIFTFIILIGLILTVFIGLAVAKIFNLNRATAKFVKASLKKSKINLSPKLNIAARTLGLNHKIIEIKSRRPVIFCYGFIRPRICIAEELVKKLNQPELLAVLKHEQYHLLSYEPSKIFLTKIISKILFFVPTLVLLTQKYQILSELAADERATHGFKNKAPLVQALAKVMELKEQIIIKNNLAVSFFAAIDERVNKLANDKYIPNLKTFSLKSLVPLIIIFVLVVSLYLPASSTQSAVVNHTDSSCPMSNEIIADDECQMSPNNDPCLMSYGAVANTFSMCDQMSLDQTNPFF